MGARNFEFSTVEFKRAAAGEFLIARGEIRNSSNKFFASAVFELVLFTRNVPIGSAKILINGFSPNQSRTFEKQFSDLNYDRVMKDMTNYEIYSESGY